MDKLTFLKGFNDLGTLNPELNHFVARTAYDVYPNKFPDAARDKLGELKRELIYMKPVKWNWPDSLSYVRISLNSDFVQARNRWRFYSDVLCYFPHFFHTAKVILLRRGNGLMCWESSSCVSRA